MGNDRRTGPVEALRNLALSLERLAASEAASGAVHGAADGLRKELPEADVQLRALLHDTLTVLGRLAHDAAEREHAEPGSVAHTLAVAFTQGALDALARERREGGLPIRGFVERLNLLFDYAVELARSRTDEIRLPGERARLIVQGVAKETSAQLHEMVPAIAEDARALAPLGAEVASKVGRGLVEGLESKLREDADVLLGLLERLGQSLVRGLAAGVREQLASSPLASGEALGASLEKLAQRTAAATLRGALEALAAGLRRPLVAAAGAGTALVVVSVFAVRWRRA